VILEIFEKRARTREAMLEVEIARLRYDLPRRREGAVQRARGQDAFQAVLVGYTNAGKSSLMRGLTGSQVPVEDKLFATLGTTVRQIRPATTPPILVSDTVGFIKNLPHELVASFRSTLDAALDADHILWVVDASDPDWRDQLEVTRDTLESLGAGRIPRTLVLNKIDRVSPDAWERLAAESPEAVQVSALDARDLLHLRGMLVAAQGRGLHETSLMVPFSQGRMLGEIHEKAQVMEERHTEDGTVLRLRAGMANLDRWCGMLGGGELAGRMGLGEA
jgi:GTPase